MNTRSIDETLDAAQLRSQQLRRLRETLDAVLPTNAFYRAKMAAAGVSAGSDIASLDDYARLPFTTKAELSEDQQAAPPYGTNLTYGPERYVRMHQTSGTTGPPLRWLDTEESN